MAKSTLKLAKICTPPGVCCRKGCGVGSTWVFLCLFYTLQLCPFTSLDKVSSSWHKTTFFFSSWILRQPIILSWCRLIHQNCSSFCLEIPIFVFYTVETRLTTTPVLRPTRNYGHFVSVLKERLYCYFSSSFKKNLFCLRASVFPEVEKWNWPNPQDQNKTKSFFFFNVAVGLVFFRGGGGSLYLLWPYKVKFVNREKSQSLYQ